MRLQGECAEVEELGQKLLRENVILKARMAEASPRASSKPRALSEPGCLGKESALEDVHLDQSMSITDIFKSSLGAPANLHL